MTRWYALFYALLVCLILSTSPSAELSQTTLDNGLTVIIEENHANPVVSVQVFVRTGSIDEQEYLGSGISHFFEHIISGGTTRTRTEAESRALLETIGNSTNAYTTTDHTAYYIHTTADHWATALELLADWMLNSLITEAEFAREKGVVQREIEQGLDNPQQQLFQLANATRYKVHPAQYPVIGYPELVQQVSRDDLLTYYQRMYAPNNMVLVIVGDVEPATALAQVKQTFGTGKRRHLPAITRPAEPPQVGKRTATKEMDIAQAHMVVSFRTVPLTHPDLYALDVLSHILSNGNSSRLVKRLKDEQQLVYRIRSGSDTPAYAPGNLSVWSTLEPDQLKAAEAAILQELYRLRDELVSPQELAKAKKQKVAEHIFNQQDVQERARSLGINMLSTYDANFDATYVDHIQQVTADSIRDVAQRYFDPDKLIVISVKPQRDTAAANRAQAAAKAEPMVKKELANGMTLLLQRQAALPIAAIHAYFKAGVRVETPATNGLTRLMSRLLLKGTAYRSADDIATTFDAMGGSIDADSGNNSFFVTASALQADMTTALDVVADVIMRPTFPAAELEKMRRLMLAAIQRRDDDWGSEAEQLFRATHFTTSPYRRLPDGQAAALKQLSREDVVAFHQNYAVPNNMVLAIIGDIDVDRTAALVERAFTGFHAGFQPRPLPFSAIPAEPTPTQTRRQVKQTNKQVAAIYIGFPGTTVSNVKDRYALHILDAVMSGIGFPGGWLHTELRGKQLVYVVHAFNWLGLEPGYFGIMAATQPDQADQVIDIILQHVEKAKAGEIDEAEFARAKQLAIVAEQLDGHTNSERASVAGLNELYDLGYDFSDLEVKRLASVTKADVQRVAQTYLHHPTIVLTTPTPPENESASHDRVQ